MSSGSNTSGSFFLFFNKVVRRTSQKPRLVWTDGEFYRKQDGWRPSRRQHEPQFGYYIRYYSSTEIVKEIKKETIRKKRGEKEAEGRMTEVERKEIWKGKGMRMKKLKREQQMERNKWKRKGSKELRISDGNKEVWKERKDEGKTLEKMEGRKKRKRMNKLKL